VGEAGTVSGVGDGQMYVAVIGIDQYRDHEWPRLHNAVSDARGALNAFVKLGFKQAVEPLLDEAATYAALHSLVTEDLSRLGKDDSLVLFFAGHGHTDTRDYSDGEILRRGYILPCDAVRGRSGTWLNVETWLTEIVQLRPRHILVILDACHSGVALTSIIRTRDGDMPSSEPLESLRARQSRRIITSALGDQRAMDSGPRLGHSLFTGYLIEALTGRLAAETMRPLITGTELGHYVRQWVCEHPRSQQTPDFGALPHDNRGELILRLPGFEPERRSRKKPPGGGRARKPNPDRDRRRRPDESRAREPRDGGLDIEVNAAAGAALDPAFVAALDRHAAERSRGASVLSIVTGEPAAARAGWAEWAAGHGYLTLTTEGASLGAAIVELLAQIPWLRCVRAARERLAAAAHRDVDALDAALDARSGRERSAWLANVTALDPQAQVSGWLLSGLREPRARVPDLTTAPVQGGELLGIACRLVAPIAVLVHHPEPMAAWLERAIPTAAALITYLPDHAVAVAAPSDLVTIVLGSDRQSAALSMARQGIVHLPPRAEGSAVRVRVRAARVLHEALARDARTAGQFVLDAEVPLYPGGPAIEVDLFAASARLAVEIDGWYHFRDPQGYRSARITDARLQRAGVFVIRFLAEDVGERLEQIVDEIAVALRGRRASRGSMENHYDQSS
jgi:very-short-patch-repair endonuclease